MKKFLRFILIITFVLVTENQIFNNLVFKDNTLTVLKVALVLTVFELLLKPIIKLLLLPINILTLGTIRIVINTLGLYLSIYFLNDFQVKNISFYQFRFEGFFAFLVTSLTISILINIFNKILSKKIKK